MNKYKMLILKARISQILTLTLVLSALAGCTHYQQQKVAENAFDMLYYMRDLEEKTVQLEDVKMSYLERQGKGPTLLLLHGFTADRNTWMNFVEFLPKDYRLIIPDLAGHGKTGRAKNNQYDLFSQSKRVHALMNFLGDKHYHLAGHSMGGAVAMFYTMQYQEQVNSLILIDNAGVKAPTPSPFMQQINSNYQPDNNALIGKNRADYEKRWPLIMNTKPFIPWPISSVLAREHIANAEMYKKVFSDTLSMREQFPESRVKQEAQTKIKGPVLLIWGEDDQIIDISSTKTLQEYMPQSQLVVFRDVGHTPITEAPKQTALAVIDFISKHNVKTITP